MTTVRRRRDDHAVPIARERFDRDGRARELERVLVFRVERGEVVACWLYDHDQRAAEELWS